MKASRAKKITEKVISVMQSYALLAAQWEMQDEEDFDDFYNSILDTIAEE